MTAQCQCACSTQAAISPEVWDKIDAIIARYKDQPGNLMPVLQEVQDAAGYLPPEVQERIVRGLNVQASEVFGVLSFEEAPTGNGGPVAAMPDWVSAHREAFLACHQT